MGEIRDELEAEDAIEWGNDLSRREADVTARELDIDRENRIEALRAASRIVAGAFASSRENGAGYGPLSPDEWTVCIAKTFAKYLEGE